MAKPLDHQAMLSVALEEARQGLAEGGIPIGAALFRSDGTLLVQGAGSTLSMVRSLTHDAQS
ncbi:MAG TPA: hypothetical protein PKN52_12440, partial [Trueperaceae bacterium]|nr:hypothetical protein [Trueperaceae bacterium]